MISRGAKTEAKVVVAELSDGHHIGRGEAVPYPRYGETVEGVAAKVLSFLEGEAMASWENELVRPGLIAAGYVASVPQNPFFGQMILDLQNTPRVDDRMAWQSVGPLFLTECHRVHRYSGLTIWPSHFFIPRHFTGHQYESTGQVFADQEWGSTLKGYDELHKRKVA